MKVRDRSLITGRGRGAATKWEGGEQAKFHPYEKIERARQVLVMLKVDTKSFGAVLAQELGV